MFATVAGRVLDLHDQRLTLGRHVQCESRAFARRRPMRPNSGAAEPVTALDTPRALGRDADDAAVEVCARDERTRATPTAGHCARHVPLPSSTSTASVRSTRFIRRSSARMDRSGSSDAPAHRRRGRPPQLGGRGAQRPLTARSAAQVLTVCDNTIDILLLDGGHCTGWKPTHAIARRLLDAFIENRVATTFELASA